MKYANAYHIDSIDDARDLTAKRFEIIHKQDWFRKIMIEIATIFAAMIMMKFFANVDFELDLSTFETSITLHSIVIHFTTSSKMILLNEIIIHNSSKKAVQDFRSIMKVFLNLWKNTDFVDMNQAN